MVDTDAISDPYDDFGGRRRQSGLTGGAKRRLEALDPPWIRAIQAQMELGGHFIVVNNPSQATVDRQHTDRHLAQIALGFARITQHMVSGRELAVVAKDVGYPPCTFSEYFEVPPGGLFTLVQGWRHTGVPTLLPFLRVVPPEKGEERRSAVLYGFGPEDMLGKIEDQYLKNFDPRCYTKSFGPETEDGIARIWFQFQVFREELAEALGVAPGAPEVGRIIGLLESQGRALRTGEVQHPAPRAYPASPVEARPSPSWLEAQTRRWFDGPPAGAAS